MSEDTFAIYRDGWKKRDLSLILSACSPSPSAQERCRKQFEAIDANGGSDFIADKLQRATLRLSTDLKTMRFYEIATDGESQSMQFELDNQGNWKIGGF